MLIEPSLRSSLLDGQVAIVTGGSRGIGGATTILLAAYGAEVVIAEVDKAKADEAVTEIDQAFGAPRAQIHL
jgi:3-oxoacyl-[acyl-carrier protein] reductase